CLSAAFALAFGLLALVGFFCTGRADDVLVVSPDVMKEFAEYKSGAATCRPRTESPGTPESVKPCVGLGQQKRLVCSINVLYATRTRDRATRPRSRTLLDIVNHCRNCRVGPAGRRAPVRTILPATSRCR